MTENDITRNWNEQLRQQLADHQETAPEDLWSRIEQRLDAEASSTPHAEEAASVLPARKRTFTLRRWAVAASPYGLSRRGNHPRFLCRQPAHAAGKHGGSPPLELRCIR